MDLSLNETQQMYVNTVSRFVKNEIIPHALEMDRGHVFPIDMLKKIWEMGIMNISIPESIKGYNVDVVSAALIIRELSYGDSGVATSAMCNDLANVVIAQHGSQAQQEAYLKPFVDSPLVSAFCLTEPAAGSDNLSMTSFITKRDDGKYVLNGSKCFITNASYASQFTVFCKVGKPSSQLMACAIIPAIPVPLDSASPIKGVREIQLPTGGKIIVGKPEDKLGQCLSNTASVTFEDVILDPGQIIGDRRLGFKYVIDVLDFARPMIAAIGVGVAKRAFDLTLSYAKERKLFGQRLCDLPVARQTLVSMWKKVELSELALLKSALKIMEDAPDKGLYSSLAKNCAAEAALFCCNEGLHLHGGYGFTNEYEISKLVRDVHIIDIYEGTREVQDMIIGRELV